MNDEREDRDERGDQPLAVVPVNTLGALVRAEIDTQIATAKSYPRSVAKFKKQALAMACLDEDTAASCFYTLPRAGKPITGPSIRLAEITGSAWGNIRYGARVIGDDGRIITAQGVCVDLEANVSATVDVQRRVTDKKGRRYSDDMVVVTGNAACSIALRNAIFKVVPMAYVNDVLAQARKVAIGDVKTLEARRADMVAYFGKMGIVPERVFAVVGKTAIEDVGLDELGLLKGLATAIKDGDTKIDDAFPAIAKPAPAAAAGSRADSVADKLRAGNGAKPPAEDLELADLVRHLGEKIDRAGTREDLAEVGGLLETHRAQLGREYDGLETSRRHKLTSLPPAGKEAEHAPR